MAGAWIRDLDFCQRAISAQYRQRFEEDGVFGSSGPVREVVAHEVGAEKIGPVTAGSVALRDTGEIELGFLQESALGSKAGLKRIFAVLCNERPEQVGPHAGVQVLANFQGDLDFFRERERNMFGDLIFRGVPARECGQIGGSRMFWRLVRDSS